MLFVFNDLKTGIGFGPMSPKARKGLLLQWLEFVTRCRVFWVMSGTKWVQAGQEVLFCGLVEFFVGIKKCLEIAQTPETPTINV